MWVRMAEKIIGILGGMGPEATADLFYQIIRATTAQKDQDHIRTIIYSNPKVPDRTAAILAGGPSPVPEMMKAAQALEKAGADFIIIPCNTAHHFIDELRTRASIPILHMIELTARGVQEELPTVERAGLIATDGTVMSRIYHRNFANTGVEIITPQEVAQKKVMKAIYEQIKAGDLEGGRETILDAANRLIGNGVQAILCGCTEVSLVLKDGDISVPVVDPLQILAETAVRVALGMEVG